MTRDATLGTAGTKNRDETSEDAPTGIAALVQRAMKLRPVRVVQNYIDNGGDVLAAGLSFQAVFAVFAALWVGFSVAGLFLQSNSALQDALFRQIRVAVPGLIGPDGAIDAETLLDVGVFGWTGAIALVVVLFTGLAWLAYTRDAVRRIFELPPPTTSFLLLKLKDLGVAVGFGIALIVSAALSVASTEALGFVFGLVGIDEDSLASTIVARIVGLTIVLALDTTILAALYRLLSGVHIPFRRLIGGALLGGIAMGLLKVLGTRLLGGASNNPLFASFAVIIGLLIWFNLISRVILICASWIAVGMADHGIPPRDLSPEQKAKERAEAEAEARRVLARAERRRLEREHANADGFTRWMLGRRLARLESERSNADGAADRVGGGN